MSTHSHSDDSRTAPLSRPCCSGEAAAVLACRQLVVGHKGRGLLPAIDFSLSHGELCAVVGRNGAGKTTWFRTLLDLLPPISGEVIRCSPDLPMAYIPQRALLDSIVPLRAFDVVAQGLLRGRRFHGLRMNRRERARVAWALSEMNASAFGDALFRELSEGQKQRVLMARLLASEPQVAVLDEPTAAMDEVAEHETLELIDKLREEHGLAVMIVSHHLRVVRRFANKVVFLDRDSAVVVAGTPQQVFSDPSFQARYGSGDA